MALVCALGVVLLAQNTPLTPLMSLRGRTDSNGYLLTSFGTYTASDGPLTPIGNLRGRTDSNGYLLMTLGGPAWFINTAPTVTSAGTSPTVPNANGTIAFRVNVGTGGTATTIVLAMPAATTGWNCNGSNLTAAAANRNPTGLLLEQSSTTTAVTMQYQTVATGVALAFTASDIVQMSCVGY